MGLFSKVDPRKLIIGLLTDTLLDEVSEHIEDHFRREHGGKTPTARDYVEHVFEYLRKKIRL